MFRWLAIALMAASIACAEEQSPSEVTGVITDVRIDSSGQVTGFTVEAGDDARYDILIDPARDYGFDLHHLGEHRSSGAPVRVDLETRDGGLYALAILDA